MQYFLGYLSVRKSLILYLIIKAVNRKGILFFLLPILFTGSHLAAQQYFGRAALYRTTTQWTLQWLASGEIIHQMKVRVLKDTLVNGEGCWLLESVKLNPEGVETEKFGRFLARKMDLNIVLWKKLPAGNWQQFGFPVLKFPLTTGRIYKIRLSENTYLKFQPDNMRAQCKVSSRGYWQGSPALPGGGEPVTWIINCILSERRVPQFIFPVYYMEPDEQAGFPGSCPVQFFFEISFGIWHWGKRGLNPHEMRTVDWSW
jgi:hypothetical protein